MKARRLLALAAWLASLVGSTLASGYDIAVEYDGQDVTYFGQWSVNGKAPNDTIITVNQGSTVQLGFIGTSIAVYGLLDSNVPNIGYNFSLDSGPIAIFTVGDNATAPYTSSPCDPAVLFNVTDLDYDNHILLVSNNIPSFTGYLAIKRFIYFDPEAPGPVPPTSCSTASGPGRPAVIAGATVGGVAGVVLIVLFIIGWRRHRRERGLSAQPPPYTIEPLELGNGAGVSRGASTSSRVVRVQEDSDTPPAYVPTKKMVVVVS